MNPTLTITFAYPDPNTRPVNINNTWDLLNATVSGSIDGSYIPYVMGHDTPSVDDQDKAWIELDVTGKPIAIKIFYSGIWRRVYNGMLNEIRMFSGDPGDTTAWDSTGLGVPGGVYDGWQICNGQNGSPNLTDKFVVGAHMDNSNGHVGYSGGWQTFVNGTSDLQTGGAKDHMIVASELPPLDSVGGLNTLVVHGFEAKETSPVHGNTAVLVDVHYADLAPHDSAPLATYGASPNGTPAVPQVAMPTLPPFIAFGYIIFVGY